MRAKGNERVAGLIANSEGAIGYVGYEFARQLGLNTAAHREQGGRRSWSHRRGACRRGLAWADMPENLRAFVPDPDGVNSYPIVTFSWVLLRKNYKNPETAKALRELFQWALRDGQGHARRARLHSTAIRHRGESADGTKQYQGSRLANFASDETRRDARQVLPKLIISMIVETMEIKTAVTALAALAQETRLSIYRLLVEAGPEGVAAGRISEKLECSWGDVILSFEGA